MYSREPKNRKLVYPLKKALSTKRTTMTRNRGSHRQPNQRSWLEVGLQLKMGGSHSGSLAGTVRDLSRSGTRAGDPGTAGAVAAS